MIRSVTYCCVYVTSYCFRMLNIDCCDRASKPAQNGRNKKICSRGNHSFKSLEISSFISIVREPDLRLADTDQLWPDSWSLLSESRYSSLIHQGWFSPCSITGILPVLRNVWRQDHPLASWVFIHYNYAIQAKLRTSIITVISVMVSALLETGLPSIAMCALQLICIEMTWSHR